MSISQNSKKPIAITTSDWHLRTTVPSSRGELDWFDVMTARMLEIKKLQAQLGSVPIIICGDLFDRHNPPATLVTWAIKNLPPNLCCICGQHDELGWDYDSRMRGAYGALVEANVINDLPANSFVEISKGVLVYGMPWGKYELPTRKPADCVSIAAVHKYLYCSKETSYSGAEEEGSIIGHMKWSQLFDVIAVGDNHIAWRARKFVNHGSLFALTSAQKSHTHVLGIVYDDGSLETIEFPEPALWHENAWVPETGTVDGSLLLELESLENDSVSFETILKVAEEKCDAPVQSVLRELRTQVFGN